MVSVLLTNDDVLLKIYSHFLNGAMFFNTYIQRGPKVTSLVAHSSRGSCAQHLHTRAMTHIVREFCA
jgi:thiamine transporter ThiT